MVAPSGCVSRDQFEAVLASLGIDTLPARSMFDAIDYNGDNHVDYKEFLCGLAALQGKGEHALKRTSHIARWPDTRGVAVSCMTGGSWDSVRSVHDQWL